eukprot:8017580-Lingulodinium_polyedra.AAC.1
MVRVANRYDNKEYYQWTTGEQSRNKVVVKPEICAWDRARVFPSQTSTTILQQEGDNGTLDKDVEIWACEIWWKKISIFQTDHSG